MSKQKAGAVLVLGAIALGVVWYRRQQALAPGDDQSSAREGGGLFDYLDSSINWLASNNLPSTYGWAAPAAGQPFAAWFDDASGRYGLPVGLLSRMAYQETGGSYRADLVSPRGATGLMQLMPIHAPLVNRSDPQASIYYAAGMMAGFYKKFGDWSKALAAYNGGPVALNKNIAARGGDWLAGASRETYNYVVQVGGDLGLINYGEQVAAA